MPLRITVLLLAVAVLGSAALVLYGVFRAGEPPKGPWRELLIIAPHPEDDVILAGELGIEVVRQGGKVRVIYVFDGSHPNDPTRAQRREADVARAWALAGVPQSALRFLDLPGSGDLGGPSPRALARVLEARRALLEELQSASQGALVHVLAEGEENQEHGFARSLTLEAYQHTNRPDLVLLESPLSHSFRSVVQAPRRAVPWVLGQLPGIGKLLAPLLTQPSFPGFVWGPAGFLLPEDPSRLALRRRMLRSFSSESDAFLRFFDYPSHYRVITEPAGSAQSRYLGYIRLSTELVGVSVLLLAAAVGVAAFALGACLTQLIERALGKRIPARVVRLVAALLGLSTLAIATLGLGGQPLRPYWLVALALGVWLSTTRSDEEPPPSAT